MENRRMEEWRTENGEQEIGGRRTEYREQRTEDGERRTENGRPGERRTGEKKKKVRKA